jgi:acyl-CoA synthetase (AMP-forming)/AMP-acid ligase II
VELGTIGTKVSTKLFTARTLARAGVARPQRPDRILRTVVALRRWGPTPAAGYTASAVRYPDEPAVIDDLGTITFADLHRRTNTLARAWQADGIGPGRGVAILCRNHRGWVIATLAASKAGADVLYLNTSFAGPQIADVCRAEAPVALVHDAEFTDLVDEAATGRRRYVAWTGDGEAGGAPTLEDLMGDGDDRELTPPPAPGRVVILTSGTTGAPKGAGRHHPRSLDPAAALLDVIPLRARERTLIAAPLFHSWGLAHFTLALSLSSTLVLRRRFDPQDTLATLARHRVEALVVVPVMLQRMLDDGAEGVRRHDLSALRVIAASGSALPGDLATEVMQAFGDVLYNLYGSTECAWATIATPADLRSAPGTAGRPPYGTVLRLYDEDGREVPRGARGRIYVGNELQFEGYTGGGNKDVIDGLMSSGDIGHLDAQGRLFVDGRDDEMIISGGENVFPREVEDLLAEHEAIEEAAVVGVDDEEFGQRLRAFVVLCAGRELTEEDVKGYVRNNLARFKVPRDVLFLDELPRNATGKVVKRHLTPAE